MTEQEFLSYLGQAVKYLGGPAIVSGAMWKFLSDKTLQRQKSQLDTQLETQKQAFTTQMAAWQAERTRELEAIKSEHTRGLKVHALQYEKEFETYQALWESVFQTYIHAKAFMPQIDYFHEGQDLVGTYRHRYELLVTAFNKAKSNAWKNFPFVPAPIEALCEEIIDTCNDFLSLAGIAFQNFERHKTSDFGHVKELAKIADHLEELAVRLKIEMRKGIGLDCSIKSASNSPPQIALKE